MPEVPSDFTIDIHLPSGKTHRSLAQLKHLLNPEDFLDHRIPLPSPETQLMLRHTSTQVDALKRLQAESTAELDALLPSILNQAFKGEL